MYYGNNNTEVIIINTNVKEAIAMNDYIKVLKANAKSFEILLERIKNEDNIKLVNEVILSTYKNKEIVEKKMNEVGIEPDQECFSDRFNNFIDEAKVNLIKGEYRFILTETDVINRTIKRIYEFLYLNKEEVPSYIDDVESAINDLEKFNIKLKKLLQKYY